MTVFGEFGIPLPWDVLHVATIKCLPGYLPGYVDFTFELLGPGYRVFRLSRNELGALGNITLSKADDRLTTLHPEPVLTTVRRASDNLITRHFNKIIRAYLNRLPMRLASGEQMAVSCPYMLEWAGIARDSALLKMIWAKSRRDRELAGAFISRVRKWEVTDERYRVNLFVLSDVQDEAITGYLDKLYQALQRDGLQTIYSKNGLQPEKAAQRIPPALDSTEVVDGKGGRPGLSGEELVY